MLFQGQEFAASSPVPLLRRPHARAGEARASRARRVPGPVPEPGRRRRCRRRCPTRPTAHVRALQARPRRARAARRGVRPAPRPAAAAARGPGLPRAGPRRRGRRGARTRGARPALLRRGSRARRPAAVRQPRPRPRLPGPRRAAARAARGDALEPALVERGHPRTAAPARPALDPADGWRPAGPHAALVFGSLGRMTDLIRRIPWPGRDDPEPASACSTREWLVTNGLGGYASGTVSGAADAPLPRPADRRPPGAARPHDDAEPPARAAPPARRDRGHHVRWLRSPPEPTRPLTAPDLAEFRLELGPARLALRGRRARPREAAPHALPPEHGPRQLPPPARRRGRSASSCGRRSTSARTSARSSDPLARPYALTVLDDRYELFGSPDLPAPALQDTRPGRRVHASIGPARSRTSSTTSEQSRGYESTGDLWSPGYFRVDARAGRRGARSSPRPSRGRPSTRSTRTRRSGPSASAASGSWRRRTRGPAPARRRSWCWRPTSSSSRRPAASTTPRAPTPPATRSARSSPATTGSPTGAATP